MRTALLEADVGFDVVQDFCERVKEKAVGVIVKVRASTKEKVRRVSARGSLRQDLPRRARRADGPGRHQHLSYAKKGPTGIMMVGLQGSGKTTTVGKLARYLENDSTSARCWSPPTSTARPRSSS